jgi:hypothetical protein
MAIQGFPDPYITCTFITDDRIFVNLFHNFTLTHYHFVYNITSGSMEGNASKYVMDCSKKNFPYKSFYNDELNEIYSFYRQGFSYIIPADDSDNFICDRMTDRDLGQMYLVYNSALICRSSS